MNLADHFESDEGAFRTIEIRQAFQEIAHGGTGQFGYRAIAIQYSGKLSSEGNIFPGIIGLSKLLQSPLSLGSAAFFGVAHMIPPSLEGGNFTSIAGLCNPDSEVRPNKPESKLKYRIPIL
ncbi:MAG: hypothetical protein WC840_02215 [Candidatus Peribacteraceae bacterium]